MQRTASLIAIGLSIGIISAAGLGSVASGPASIGQPPQAVAARVAMRAARQPTPATGPTAPLDPHRPLRYSSLIHSTLGVVKRNGSPSAQSRELLNKLTHELARAADGIYNTQQLESQSIKQEPYMSVNHASFDKETRCKNPLYQFCWLSVVTVLCCAPVRPIEKYSTSTAKKEQAPTKAAVNIEKGLLLASLKDIPISSTQSPHEDRIRWIPQSKAVPSGKGVWIWHFQYTGLSASQIADLCVKYKIGYVLLKSGNGSSYWGASRNKNLHSRFNEEVVKEFTSRGIQVIAWHYVYTNNIKEQVRAIIEGASVPGVSGMILDAEDEFEHNSGTEARALCDGIREKMPNLFLGYTSFGWVGSHQEFPYTEFDQYCGDAFMPQIYWGDRKGGDPQKSYRQASAMIRTAKLHAPVWMVQSNGDSDGIPKRMVSTLKLNTFFSMAGPFSSLWQWPHRKVPKKLAQFAELHLSNEVAPLAKESH